MTTADALATFSAVQAELAAAACVILDLVDDQGDDIMTTTAITNRNEYLALFATTSDALEHEGTCLSIGREYLPPAARAVLDDADAEPAPAYWQWLADQMAATAEADEEGGRLRSGGVVSREGWVVRTADGLPDVGDYVADVKESQLYRVVEAHRPELGSARSGDSVYSRRVQVESASWDDASDEQIHTARMVWADPIWRA